MTAALSMSAFGQSGKSVVFTENGSGIAAIPAPTGTPTIRGQYKQPNTQLTDFPHK